MRIAFCTTCKGRLMHLRETLPWNLAHNSRPNTKFVVLDYGDREGLSDFLREQIPLADGRLVVYSYRTDEPFHVSHAKNMAARCGILEGADVLVTLDADNFTGVEAAHYIAENIREGAFLCPDFPHIQSLPHGPERPLRGFAGRLAIRAMDFVKMGGYDEIYNTWYGEDIDMIARLQRLGYAMRCFPNQYLKVIPHTAWVRFKEYPHAKIYENKRELKRIAARKETVVNFGRFGMGTVFRNYGEDPIEIGPLPTRVFGIGMHKTGTTSLDKAFKILGLDSFHWGRGEAPLIWQEMHSGGRSNTLERWFALSDLPIPLLYEKLDKAYPGSKFILTVREESGWLESVKRLWDAQYNPTRWMWDVYPFTNRIHRAMYGRVDFEPQAFIKRYREHNAGARLYFKDRTQDFLELDVSRARWPGLCAFLGRPQPDEPFPWENKTVDLKGVECQKWMQKGAGY